MFQCDDNRGCVMQFWPPYDEHMCLKHVEAWNKLIAYCKTKILCIKLVNYWDKYTEMHGQQNIKICYKYVLILYKQFMNISTKCKCFFDNEWISIHTEASTPPTHPPSFPYLQSENGTWWHTHRNQIRSSSETGESIYIGGGVSSVEYWLSWSAGRGERLL